jgi:hypothetical protein
MTYEAHAKSCPRKARYRSWSAGRRELKRRTYRGGVYRCLCCSFIHITSDRIVSHETI